MALRFLRFLHTKYCSESIDGADQVGKFDPLDGSAHPHWSSVRQYLLVALRLFIATSGIYDPLKNDYSLENLLLPSKSEVEKATDRYFKAAQDAVKQDSWKSKGISGSMQYLQDLFQDTGDDWPARPTSLRSTEAHDDTASESLELVNRQRAEVKDIATR